MLRSAEAHYRRQQRLTATAVLAARRVWQQVESDAVLDSWNSTRATVVVAQVQRAAARDAADYVGLALDEQNIAASVEGRVAAGAFAGRASDGRPLNTLLTAPAYRTLNRLGRGMAAGDALAAGGKVLDRIVTTQIQDAARGAASVGMVARPAVTGYVRMLNPPSCSRCAVLAGKFYEWNAGFLRHPNCDCRHVPSTAAVAGDLRTDPRAYFESLDAAQQRKVFTAAGAKAIRDGADIGQVVNARRGMSTAGGAAARRTTTAGARRGQQRLTPEGIYELASDRGEAIRLLRAHRYLV